jgi:isoleucyl-tRNA synthetase
MEMKKEITMPDFVKMDHEVLDFWNEDKSFDKLRAKNAKTGKYYAFLDGPITANNEMKLHHVWNRSLKDIMLRYKGMQGYDSCYQNGFDAQGLWVEVGVEKELGLKDKRDIVKYGIDNFTEYCISRVKHFAGVITEQSKRLGQWMDWDNSYFTNSDTNITSIWYFLQKCYKKGWLIEKYRPMPWCSHCGTSLSEHELADSYTDIVHTAVFFRLPINNSNKSILVWTTTPWTLSSNVAVAVNPGFTYCECKVKSTNRTLIVCESDLKVLKDDLIEVIDKVKGSELVGLTYETCFPEIPAQNFEHKIVAWDMVDSVEGSGAVHIAPGCGAEDFELGEKLGLPKICPVDENGIFLDNFGFFSNKSTKDVADEVFEELKKRDKLYYTHSYKHRYPICWRCKQPLIFRLSKEWYIKADEIRPELIKAVDTVDWQPPFIKKRMLDWLNNMGDWNISRKRFYGLPLPFYRCKHCGELTVVGSLEELEKLSSKEEVESLPHLHRPYIDKIKIRCPKCGEEVERVTEVGDCWLDAGVTPFSTKKYFTDKEYWKKNFPAECVIEMKEQIRLWFYSLLFMSVTLEGVAPYKKVIGFAMLVAEDGSKFSKSGPNNISFNDIVEKVGADVLRYIFASNNMLNDTRFSENICDDTRRKLLSLWNAYVFFNTYAYLDKPKLDGYKPNESELNITDRWLIDRTNDFIDKSTQNYETNTYFQVIKDFEDYVDELSNWYIRINRRRFWKSDDEKDKLNAYYSLYYALKKCIQVMTPIIPFMSEHIWQNLVRCTEKNEAESIMLGGFAKKTLILKDENLINKTKSVREVIATAQMLRNDNQIKIKQPLKNMFVVVHSDEEEGIKEFESIIKDELNIKNIEFVKDANKFNLPYLTINFKVAGAVLKNKVNDLKNTLQSLSDEEMLKVVDSYNKGQVVVGDYKLDSSLFVLNFKPRSEFVIATQNDKTVVLDVTIDKNLMIEGLSRELIRQIQTLRKDNNFLIEQRITLCVQTDSDDLKQVISTYKDKIMQEVLATNFVNELDDSSCSKEVDFDGDKATIKIKQN